MSTVEFFCQETLQKTIAPRGIGSVQSRIRKAAMDLGWSYTRTKDAWYGDPRISIRPDELFRVEAVSGLEYARREMRNNDRIIARADALLHSQDPDFNSAFVVALRAFAGVFHRSRASGE